MSFPTAAEMQVILNTEISSLEQREQEFLRAHLVPFQPKTLKWEYGNDEPFPAWIIADLQERDVGIAYCQGGHGAHGDTWGLIFFHDHYFGLDAGWYRNLQELLEDGWV